jgi:hypothetical protein
MPRARWREALRIDPLSPLLSSQSEALSYFARRDLLEESTPAISQLWQLPEPRRIAGRQQPDGSWRRRGKQKHPDVNYHLIETWKQFRILVQMYGCNRESEVGRKAAEYILSCQTDEGDIRGMLANQYATYYTGALLYLLLEAGYEGDRRVEAAFEWLLSMRQDDGGWSIPMITHKLTRQEQLEFSGQLREPLQPDRTKPFSHNATGMILRAFAAHSRRRRSEAARAAAQLLTTRFFKEDAYSSYRAARYWVQFEYPYWWNQLVAALDSVALIGISRSDDNVSQALAWLVDKQQDTGLWKTSYAVEGGRQKEHAGSKGKEEWVSLAICRVLKRYYP